jgi:hypothetical protein
MFNIFLTLALDGDGLVSLTLCFTPGERGPSVHWIRGWVGFKTSVNKVKMRNFSPLLGIKP